LDKSIIVLALHILSLPRNRDRASLFGFVFFHPHCAIFHAITVAAFDTQQSLVNQMCVMSYQSSNETCLCYSSFTARLLRSRPPVCVKQCRNARQKFHFILKSLEKISVVKCRCYIHVKCRCYIYVKCRCYTYMDEMFTLQLARTSDISAGPAKRHGAPLEERDISAGS
jgi:hypothetical protein